MALLSRSGDSVAVRYGAWPLPMSSADGLVISRRELCLQWRVSLRGRSRGTTCQSTRTHNSRRRLRRSCWWSGHLYVMSHARAPRFQVDFNEFVGDDVVLLSRTDARVDDEGRTIQLSAGLAVLVYEYNLYDDGTEECLYAEGVAELNRPEINGEWTRHVRWCCRFQGGVKVLPHALPARSEPSEGGQRET